MEPKESLVAAGWQVVSNQRWDEITKSWIITTLRAPADIVTKDLIDKLGLEGDANGGMP